MIIVACPGSPMDKTMDSGSINAGSIPARDTINKRMSMHSPKGEVVPTIEVIEVMSENEFS